MAFITKYDEGCARNFNIILKKYLKNVNIEN